MKKFDIPEFAKKISKKFPQTAAVLAAAAAIFLFFGGAENGDAPAAAGESREISLDGKWELKFWPQPDSGALRTPQAAAEAKGATVFEGLESSPMQAVYRGLAGQVLALSRDIPAEEAVSF